MDKAVPELEGRWQHAGNELCLSSRASEEPGKGELLQSMPPGEGRVAQWQQQQGVTAGSAALSLPTCFPSTLSWTQLLVPASYSSSSGGCASWE